MRKDGIYYQESMFKGAPAESFLKADVLRKNMTPAEKQLWERLKELPDLKFRRQHPIHLFIVDFYCHECKLVIEIDGDYHNSKDQKEKDSERTKLLIFQDLSILRFTNQEVFDNMDAVIDKIMAKINDG